MAEAEAVNPAAVLIDAGFKLVEAGIEELKKGDVVVRKPDSPVGVRAENMPEELRAKLTLITQRKVIWTYRATKAGLQTASIKLVCEVQYNGPEVQAAFDLAPDGMRARLGTDATIEIQNPLLLDRLAAPPGWRAAGFKLLPVAHVRTSIFVDEPWPNSNLKATFDLVLSGLYGFGKSPTDKGVQHYEEFPD
jgi:hypothetical protein